MLEDLNFKSYFELSPMCLHFQAKKRWRNDPRIDFENLVVFVTKVFTYTVSFELYVLKHETLHVFKFYVLTCQSVVTAWQCHFQSDEYHWRSSH